MVPDVAGDFDCFTAAPRGGKNLLRPDFASNGGDGIAEGAFGLWIPSGGSGREGLISGEVNYQAREIGCNIFELHWKETHKGDTVTHIEDFGREQVCTNITNINRTPIPDAFDPLDLTKQLNSKDIFADGSPVASDKFPFFTLCRKMYQSRESDKVWENKLHSLVYVSP